MPRVRAERQRKKINIEHDGKFIGTSILVVHNDVKPDELCAVWEYWPVFRSLAHRFGDEEQKQREECCWRECVVSTSVIRQRK